MKTLALTSFIFSIALHATNTINTPMVLPVSQNVTVLQSKSDKELAWVDEQIQAILPARIGVSDGFVNSLIDPIKYTVPARIQRSLSAPIMNFLAPPKLGSLPIMPSIPKIVEEPLRLQALMNKSALINGKWYKVNDSIRTYTVAEIKPSSILLNGKKGQPLILFLNKTNTNIQINTK